MSLLAQQGDVLQPSEALLDALSASLADGVAGMPHGSGIDRTAPAPARVPRHMRCHSEMTALGHELRHVISLVGACCHTLRSRNLLQHQQSRVALCPSVCFQQLRIYDQPVAVLHQEVAAVT